MYATARPFVVGSAPRAEGDAMTEGKTRDAGWHIGVSRTLAHPLDRVWTVLIENPALWLAPGVDLPAKVGDPGPAVMARAVSYAVDATTIECA